MNYNGRLGRDIGWFAGCPASRIRCLQGRTIGYAELVPRAVPPLCPVSSRRLAENRFVDKKENYSIEGFLDENVVTDGPWIATDYSAARKPVADPGTARPLRGTIAEIDGLYEQAQAWAERRDVR
jgi:hypothetical protein